MELQCWTVVQPMQLNQLSLACFSESNEFWLADITYQPYLCFAVTVFFKQPLVIGWHCLSQCLWTRFTKKRIISRNLNKTWESLWRKANVKEMKDKDFANTTVLYFYGFKWNKSQWIENFLKACFRTHLKIAQNKDILLLIIFLPVKRNRRKLSRKLFLRYY